MEPEMMVSMLNFDGHRSPLVAAIEDVAAIEVVTHPELV
jgi:hypothetical protein